MKKVLHLLTGGNPGGIETLCREISRTALFENGFVFMTFGGKIYEQMKSAGAIVYPLFELGNTLCIKKMDELIRISKLYDVLIIHHEDPFLCLYYCNTLKKVGIPGMRYVHSCYDDYWLKYKNPLKNHIFHFIMQRTLDLSKRVVFVSEAGRKSCNNQYHVDKHKQKVIYNGISNELLLMGKKNSLNIDYYSNNIIEILYIGRLSYIKGIDKLIIAVSNILRNKKIHLTIVGDGDDRLKLMQMVEDLSIREHVSFEGFQTSLERYLSRAVYFVYPSACNKRTKCQS